MESKEFSRLRKKLGKTQKQMAALLGVSIKAVHSYEQAWRSIPAHIERQMLFLVYRKFSLDKGPKCCWTATNCPLHLKKKCPAWEFGTGNLCWFVCGTRCGGEVQQNWHEKMKMCRACDVFHLVFASITEE